MNKLVINNKHAYLIMAHHKPELLKRLIKALDDERNDIFLHIDKKSNMCPNDFKVNKANIYFIKRMDVHWGGYTQIDCEYRLLEAAVNNGEYDYYHLLTGASYPLWNQNYIHEFFKKHFGLNFIGFDCHDFSERAKYYYFASEYGKCNGIKGWIVQKIRIAILFLQKALKYNRLRYFKNLEIKKGLAYWSVTQEVAEYILSKEKYIKDLLGHSISGDEIFVQTLVYNSSFRDKIFDYDCESKGSSRLSAWESSVGSVRDGCNFIAEDISLILKSECCFAFKFESEDGIKLIDIINDKRCI